MLDSEFLLLLIFSLAIIYLVINRFMIIFINRIRRLYALQKSGKKTVGIIVDYQTDKDADGAIFYLPTVEYNINEITRRRTIDVPSNRKPVIGNSVVVYYDEKDSENVVVNIDEAFKKNFIGVVFLTLIILLIIFFLIKKVGII